MAILTRNIPDVSRTAPLFAGRSGVQAFVCVLWLALLGWLGGAATALTAESTHQEQQVKAAFLVNFPKYVDWSVEALADTNTPVIIAVLGETKVIEELQKIIPGRTINGRTIILKRLKPEEELRGNHIVFISAAEQRRSPDSLTKLRESGVLTVGESDDFLERGGIINLVRRGQKIAMEVNLAAADKAQLKISSKLLSVATVVKVESR